MKGKMRAIPAMIATFVACVALTLGIAVTAAGADEADERILSMGEGAHVARDLMWDTYTDNPNCDANVVRAGFASEEFVTVSFDAKGGTGAPVAQTIPKGGYAQEPAYADNPRREHYGFGHWYAGTDVTDTFNFYSPVQNDVVLNAAWVGIVYAEENVVNSSEASLDPGTISVDGTVKDLAATLAYEGTDVLLKAAANEGFAFVGWARETGNADAPYEVVSTEVTYTVTMGDAAGATFGWLDLGFPGMGDALAVYALFERQATVTFQNEDGTVLQSGKVAYGQMPEFTGETPTKAATERCAYAFAGWDKEIEPVTGDVTYMAMFTEIPIVATLTFDYAGGTRDGKDSLVIEANVGDTIAIPAAPVREGYAFKHWQGSEYQPGDTYVVEGDHTFTAVWEKDAEPEPAGPSGQDGNKDADGKDKQNGQGGKDNKDNNGSLRNESDNRGGIPGTGDANSLAAVAMLAAFGLAALFGAAALRRKEQ